MASLIRSIVDLSHRSVGSFPAREEARDVLLCSPDHFDVIDVKNPHMKNQIGQVDRSLAQAQWKSLREAVVAAGRRVRLIDPTLGLEDMVFTANPVLPDLSPKGERVCLLSNMKHLSRKREVEAHERWFASRGYKIVRLSHSEWDFEGQGDALWHPGRRLLWGGYGFRTVVEAYREISEILSTDVAVVKLMDERFYHLDTCLAPLSEKETLWYPGAFDETGRALVRALFQTCIEVPEREAAEGFACNPLVLDRKVLIQKGNAKTCAELRKRGYDPIELDTSEYMKSGGSVFCMKMMVFSDG